VNVRRGGLGRGLGALIPNASRPEPEAGDVDAGDLEGGAEPVVPEQADAPAHFAELPLDAIVANARQPRQVFDEEAMAELVHSIREVGLLQPIVVRPVTGRPEAGSDHRSHYELVMGERRWRAAQLAGLARIPAIVRDTEDEAMLRDALLENLHRSQLNPLEEAAAYDQMLQDFGCTHEELARRIGRSRPQISNTLRLLKLPPAVQRRVAAGVLSAGHARALLSIEGEDAQDRMAHRIVAEGLSVRAVEEIAALGGPDAPVEPRRRAKALTAPGLDELASRLSDRLETRVRVQMGRTRGKVTIDFATLDDLDRIVVALEGPSAH
jgi:ParB family chromosome partitioning protein